MSKAVEKRRDIAPVPQGQLVATAIPESSLLQQTEDVDYFGRKLSPRVMRARAQREQVRAAKRAP